MAVMSMSTKEFGRLEVLLSVQSGRLRVDDASQLMGICRRSGEKVSRSVVCLRLISVIAALALARC